MLEGWKTSHILPANITRELLDAALMDGHAALRPATSEEFAVHIERLIKFAEVFGIKDAGIREASKFYVEALDDLPQPLLAKAVDHVVRNYKYGHRMPPPADLRAVVEGDMERLQGNKARIESALRFGEYAADRPEPTDEMKARVSAIVQETKRNLEVPQ